MEAGKARQSQLRVSVEEETGPFQWRVPEISQILSAKLTRPRYMIFTGVDSELVWSEVHRSLSQICVQCLKEEDIARMIKVQE